MKTVSFRIVNKRCHLIADSMNDLNSLMPLCEEKQIADAKVVIY